MGQNKHQEHTVNIHSVIRTKSKAECLSINTKAISSGSSSAASLTSESSYTSSSTTCGSFSSSVFLQRRIGPSTWLIERTQRHYSSTGPCLWHSAWSQRCLSELSFSKFYIWCMKEAFTRYTNYCDMDTKPAFYPYQSLQPWATSGRRL